MTQHLLNRDGRVARLLVLAAAGVLAASSGSAQDVSAVELEATKLSDTVYLLLPSPPLAGNLAVSAGDDGLSINGELVEAA